MAALTTPIVALDVPNAEQALAIVDELGDSCRFYKIGNELFTAEGRDVVTQVIGRGCDVFLDLKFHDIPNTVSGGVRNAAAMGARLVTVHAAGGEAMLEAAVAAAGDQSRCGVLALTVLTSLTAGELALAWGRRDLADTGAEVLRLADLARRVGTHGIVCSGLEAAAVTRRWGDELAVLVPGVRPQGGATQDQARVVTPAEAAGAGARYIVLGRMVTAAPDRRAAMLKVLAELSELAE